MHGRVAYLAIAVGSLDFAYAGGVTGLVARGESRSWLGLVAVVVFAAGAATWSNAVVIWRLPRNAERAAGTLPTTLARPHVPLSFPAKARAPLHRSADLLARDDR